MEDQFIFKVIRRISNSKEQQYNMMGLVNMYVEGKSLMLPSKLINVSFNEMSRFSKEYASQYVLKDLVQLVAGVEMSIRRNNEWQEVDRFSFPIVRKTKHLSYADANKMVQFADAKGAKRGGFNYVCEKVDGLLGIIFLAKMYNVNEFAIMYVNNEMHYVRSVMPMSGELTSTNFVLQAGFHPEYTPTELTFKGKTYAVKVPKMLEKGDYYECIGGIDGIEYKFKDLPTVDVEHIEKKDVSVAVEPLSKAEICIIHELPQETAKVVECVIAGNALKYIKDRPDKAFGQTAEEIGKITVSVTCKEVKEFACGTPQYKKYVPDEVVYSDFYNYVLKTGGDNVAYSFMYEDFLKKYDTYIHTDQENRIRYKYYLNETKGIKLKKPVAQKKRVEKANETDLIKFFFDTGVCLSPHHAADAAANMLNKVVDLGMMIEMCAYGDLLYNNNSISSLRNAGKYVYQSVRLHTNFFEALIHFFLNDRGKHVADNRIAYAVKEMFNCQHSGVGTVELWEKFAVSTPQCVSMLIYLCGNYSKYRCVGDGAHVCSHGGMNHSLYNEVDYIRGLPTQTSTIRLYLIRAKDKVAEDVKRFRNDEYDNYVPFAEGKFYNLEYLNDDDVGIMLYVLHEYNINYVEGYRRHRKYIEVACRALEVLGESVGNINSLLKGPNEDIVISPN